MITQKDMIENIQNILGSSGILLSNSVIKLVIDTQNDLIKKYLNDREEILFDGLFSVRVKSRGYRSSDGSSPHYTMKVEAKIDPVYKKELIFRDSLSEGNPR